jgi:hypothetical protein
MTDASPASSFLDELRAYIRNEVAAGFWDASEVEQAALDYFEEEPEANRLEPSLLHRIVGVETDRAFAAQLDLQRQWPAVTDCDRLDRAFGDLNRSGIVARQNFACCTNCGHVEIGAEIDAAEKSGAKVIGYTFYHFQGTECAVELGDLYLAYSDLKGEEEASVRAGRSIVDTLERHGLTVEWNGSFKQAILVKLTWQRRISKAMAKRDPRIP